MKRVIKMASMLITSPSFAALAMTGLAILLIAVMWIRKVSLATIGAATLFAILIGVHGLLHLGVEWVYDYNPLA